MTDNNKGTSLLHYSINYACKKFYDTGPSGVDSIKLSRSKNSLFLVLGPLAKKVYLAKGYSKLLHIAPIRLDPGPNVIKLFKAVIYDFFQ